MIQGLALVTLPTMYTGALSLHTIQHRALLGLWSCAASLRFAEVVDAVTFAPADSQGLPHALPGDSDGYQVRVPVFQLVWL